MFNPYKYAFCAVSSRVRLARNLADFPFSSKAGGGANEPIIELVARTLRPLGQFTLIKMSELDALQAEYLKEKYVISPLLMQNRISGGVIVNEDETLSVMINEEDHLRIQCVAGGFDLFGAYENLVFVSNKLAERMKFAFDSDYRYVTACLTNLGTGMRASVMLLLPALTRSGKIKKYISEMKALGLVVRGAFGEGSEPEGCLYQISNEVTLAYDEEEILGMVDFCASKICEAEIAERNERFRNNPLEVEDECMRAYAILKSARLISYEEFLRLYVSASLGGYYGFYNVDVGLLNSLLVNMRPAVLEYVKTPENKQKRDELRAQTLRGVL